MTKHTKEMLGTAFSCLACFGFMLSMGSGMGQTTIARFLLFAGLGAALLVIVLDGIRGRLMRSLVGVVLWCSLGFGLGYIPYTYLQQAYADQPLFEFSTK